MISPLISVQDSVSNTAAAGEGQIEAVLKLPKDVDIRVLFNMVCIPLLVIASLAVGFVLVHLRDILVPFVIGVFIVYLLRPLVVFLTQPMHCCMVGDTVYREYEYRSNIYLKKHECGSTSECWGQVNEESDAMLESGKYGGSRPGHRRRKNSKTYGRVHTFRDKCGSFRIPHWLAVVVSLCITGAILVALVLMVVQAVQEQQQRLTVYENRAIELSDSTLKWFKSHIGLDDVVKDVFYTTMMSLMDAFFIILVVVYPLDIEDDVFQNYDGDYDRSSIIFTNEDVIDDSIQQESHKTSKLGLKSMSDGNDKNSTSPILARSQASTSHSSQLNPRSRRVRNPGGLLLSDRLDLHSRRSSHSKGIRDSRSLKQKIDSQIQKYIGIKTLISAVVGGAVWIFLGPVLHILTPHLFGVLTFLLNYIPNVGPIIATVLPMPFVILDPNNEPVVWLLAFLGPACLHAIVGNFIEPALFGHSMELHPVVVLMSLALWYSLWGAVGAILAVPLTAVMRIIVAEIDHPYALFIALFLDGQFTTLLNRGVQKFYKNVDSESPVSNSCSVQLSSNVLSRVFSRDDENLNVFERARNSSNADVHKQETKTTVAVELAPIETKEM